MGEEHNTCAESLKVWVPSLHSAAPPALLSTGCASSGVILANFALTMWTVKWLLLYFVALSNISQRVGCTIWWTICLCVQQQYT